MNRYIILTMLWTTWCFLHSALNTQPVLDFVKRHFGKQYPYYRIFYNLIALLTLAPVLLYSATLESPLVFRWDGPWRIVQVILLLSAAILFVAGAKQYDLVRLLGLRPPDNPNDCRALTDDCRLEKRGILGFVRHPWYTGGILIVWSRDLTTAACLTSTIITGYFLVGTLLEEKKLIREYGEEYRRYQKEVSMLFPVKWLIQKLNKAD
jgi:protein-S-isoprenylcysteine O-methyltransferase Ste14